MIQETTVFHSQCKYEDFNRMVTKLKRRGWTVVVDEIGANVHGHKYIKFSYTNDSEIPKTAYIKNPVGVHKRIGDIMKENYYEQS